MTHVHSLFGPVLEGFTKGPTMIEDTKATTEERIAALRARIEGAETREKAAFIETHRARAELAAAEGRDWDRQYHEALADAQAHIPGGHERFWRLCNTRDAQRIIAGEATLTDFAPHERTGIAAEVERLRAESGAATT